jgi:hypothetical protein
MTVVDPSGYSSTPRKDAQMQAHHPQPPLESITDNPDCRQRIDAALAWLTWHHTLAASNAGFYQSINTEFPIYSAARTAFIAGYIFAKENREVPPYLDTPKPVDPVHPELLKSTQSQTPE